MVDTNIDIQNEIQESFWCSLYEHFKSENAILEFEKNNQAFPVSRLALILEQSLQLRGEAFMGLRILVSENGEGRLWLYIEHQEEIILGLKREYPNGKFLSISQANIFRNKLDQLLETFFKANWEDGDSEWICWKTPDVRFALNNVKHSNVAEFAENGADSYPFIYLSIELEEIIRKLNNVEF